jgi:hypothetical protein
MNNKSLRAWLEGERRHLTHGREQSDFDKGMVTMIGIVLSRLESDPEPGDNKKYRLAWEEMSALIHVNSGMTPVEVDMIARKHGIREE